MPLLYLLLPLLLPLPALAADGFDPREAAWYWQQYAASPDDLRAPDRGV